MPIINPKTIAAEQGETPLPMDEFLAGNEGDSVLLPPDADLNALAPRLSGLKFIDVEFPAFTDGRGFSIAKQLRRMGFEGVLTAAGPLIPDQYVYALQCGFDQVKIDAETFDRFGADDFTAALNAFSLTYQRGYVHSASPSVNVFEARAAARNQK